MPAKKKKGKKAPAKKSVAAPTEQSESQFDVDEINTSAAA